MLIKIVVALKSFYEIALIHERCWKKYSQGKNTSFMNKFIKKTYMKRSRLNNIYVKKSDTNRIYYIK